MKNAYRFFAIGLFVTLAISNLSSCSKEEMAIDEPVVSDRFYVRYNIYGPGPYGRFSNWTATTPDGGYSNSGYQTSNWNETYGPVNKGFNCAVRIGYYQGGTPTIQIYVSKNDEPFALKETVTGASASYVIE